MYLRENVSKSAKENCKRTDRRKQSHSRSTTVLLLDESQNMGCRLPLKPHALCTALLYGIEISNTDILLLAGDKWSLAFAPLKVLTEV